MKKFNNTILLLTESSFSHIGGYLQASDDLANMVPNDDGMYYRAQADLWETHYANLEDLDIPLARLAVERFIEEMRKPKCSLTIREVMTAVEEVRSRFHDEVEARGSFFYIPIARADKFDSPEPFGAKISAKFPRFTEDIQEAHKCYACARYTACVFHLMRVMESSLQRLGKKLKTSSPVETTNWQEILDQVNKSIKAMNHKLPKTKKLAEIASHLYNVKLAWRNEVMHPKSTYTEEEAAAIITQVGVYLRGLAEVV